VLGGQCNATNASNYNLHLSNDLHQRIVSANITVQV
jgi:hypothetical protein